LFKACDFTAVVNHDFNGVALSEDGIGVPHDWKSTAQDLILDPCAPFWFLFCGARSSSLIVLDRHSLPFVLAEKLPFALFPYTLVLFTVIPARLPLFVTMPLQPANNNKPPSPATIRNPYVKSTSIHSSFQSLTAETDKYRKATQRALEERQALQLRLQTSRHKTQELAEEIRAAQDTLGGSQRDISLWLRQEKYLRDKLIQDRLILGESTKMIQAFQETEKQDKKDFCQKMSGLNHELGRLLRQHEEERLVGFIHPETVADVLLGYENNDGGSEEPRIGQDDSPARDERQAWQAALSALQEAADEHNGMCTQEENYSDQIREFRHCILEDENISAESREESSLADPNKVRFLCVCVRARSYNMTILIPHPRCIHHFDRSFGRKTA
jgi:hypothetical protein